MWDTEGERFVRDIENKNLFLTFNSTSYYSSLPCYQTSCRDPPKSLQSPRRNSSTCLGLTCKKFYPIHRALRGVVPLNPYYPFNKAHDLGQLLQSWVPSDLTYKPRLGKFIDKDKLRQLKVHWRLEQKRQSRDALRRAQLGAVWI